MKVLHLISSGGMYGAEAVILNLSAALNTDSPEASSVGIFAHAGTPEPALYRAAVAAGVTAELVPCRGQLDLEMVRRLRALAARFGSDIVHAHGYKADIYAYLAFRGSGRPALVSTCHTWYDNDVAVRAYGVMDRWVLRSFDEVVGVSAAVRARLVRAGVQEGRISLVRNGIQITTEAPCPEEERLRRPGDSLRVGLVGRLAPEKGVDVFLRAVAQIADRFPGVQFVVAGEGPERAALEALIRQLGMSGRVVLLGRQTEMRAFYRSLDVLVSASRLEGLPMALLEGMGSGLPVVATAVGEVPAVVADGVTGLLVPPEQPAALAGAMERLLVDADLRQRFGDGSRERVLNEFSADRMARDYVEVYRRASEGRKRAVPVLRKSVR